MPAQRRATPVSRPRSRRAPAAPDAVVAPHECDPTRCPCDDATCSLSRYARAVAAVAAAADGPAALSPDGSAGERTLEATELAVARRLDGLPVDMTAMVAVSNIYRAANAVRNHVERTVLAPHDLTWTGWVVLWVVWIWGEAETRHVASEAGISKGTLTGVQSTLGNRGLLRRRVHPDDRRRALLSLTPKGRRLMGELFPRFNAEEAFVVGDLAPEAQLALGRSLRGVVKRVEQG